MKGNLKFNRKVTVEYCKILYGFVNNRYGNRDNSIFCEKEGVKLLICEDCESKFHWMIEYHLKSGFNKDELRELRINFILE